MTLTSAQAAKLLRKLKETHTNLLDVETRSSTFQAAMGENAEELRPTYDFAGTQERLASLEKQIRALKHAINVFNSTHIVGDTGMTADELLVYIPQLTNAKMKLDEYYTRLPKERTKSYSHNNNIIDYTYINYDLKEAAAEYNKVADALSHAQMALDLFNSTETFEFEF